MGFASIQPVPSIVHQGAADLQLASSLPPCTSLLLKQSKSRASRPHIRGTSQEEGEEGTTQQEGDQVDHIRHIRAKTEQVEHGREDRTSNREKEKERKGRRGRLTKK